MKWVEELQSRFEGARSDCEVHRVEVGVAPGVGFPQIRAAVGRVNARPFVGFPPGLVRLTGFTMNRDGVFATFSPWCPESDALCASGDIESLFVDP